MRTMNGFPWVTKACLLLVFVAFFFPNSHSATEDQKIAPSDGVAVDEFGISVSVSDDTALIGAYRNDDNSAGAGAAYVYIRDFHGTWSQQQKLFPSDPDVLDYFGFSVAVSGDTAVIGAYLDDDGGIDSGSAYVFTRDINGIWSQQAKLTASDAAANDEFGFSVALSGDTAVIGAYQDDDGGTNSGSAYVFTRDINGIWSQQAKLTASDAAAFDRFGYSVSLSGNSAVIGSFLDDDNATDSGSAYVFVRDINGIWSEQAKLTASDPTANDQFGYSVSVFDDRVLVGARFDDDDGGASGSAYIFVRDMNNMWSEQAKLTASDALPSANFGFSVDLSEKIAVIGARADDAAGPILDTGSVYAFTDVGNGVWVEQSKLISSDGATSDNLGWSISISGKTVIGGAPFDDDNGTDSGSVYIFNDLDIDDDGILNEVDSDLDGDAIPNLVEQSIGLNEADVSDGSLDLDIDGWSNVDEYWSGTNINDPNSNPANQINPHQKTFGGDGTVGDEFGTSVSISGNTAIIGAKFSDDNGSNSGSVYTLTRDSNGIWKQQAKLNAADGSQDDQFGISVSISGNTAVIGAWADDDNGAGSGSAYVFTRDINNIWRQEAKLTASDGAAVDLFGVSVSISGDTAVVGARSDDDDGSNSGSAYVFVRDTNDMWSEQTKLTASDGAAGDQFGISVSISGDTAVIGAHFDDDNGTDSGSAYVFVRDTNDMWSEQTKLTASDGAAGDQFGISVSISGDTAVIGAHFDDDNGTSSGSAYVFVRDTNDMWSQQAKMLPSDSETGIRFGNGVSISGDTAIVGARFGDAGSATRSGSAYVFTRDANGIWSELAKLNANDGMMDDQFGLSVSVSEDTVFTGAQFDSDTGSASGSAYSFDLDLDDDGLLNNIESIIATDPIKADTDEDGLTDGDEVNTYNTDPLLTDTDTDGLSDGDEIDLHSTDPLDADSDDDGFNDGDEINAGTDPNDSSSTPSTPTVNVPLPLWSYLLISTLLLLIAVTFQRRVRRFY